MTTTTPLTGLPTTAAAPSRPETLTGTWQDRSACYNRPEQWWDGDNPTLTDKARAVCLSCPVLAECLGEQMQLEGGRMWSRSSVRGGLTGAERIQLCIDEQTGGPYDAEEARLLALEAGAYGTTVTEVAEDGVSDSTLRLAARMAGEHVPNREAQKVRKDTALARAMDNAPQIMAWREDNVSRTEICARLKIGRAAVDQVIRTYRALTGEVGARKLTLSDAEECLINDYLDGQTVRLTHDQHLAAVVEGMSRGMTYRDIDRARGEALNTTAQFVSRMRKKYQEQGQEFPITTMSAKRLTFTDEQVVEMRETYAAGGVTDLDLALRYGVPRNVISHALSGRNYKHVGGPIRAGRSEAAKAASKAANDSVCRMAFAPRQARKQTMEEAA